MSERIDLLPVPTTLPAPSEAPDLLPSDDIGSGLDSPYRVIVYDDDYHTFPQVETQLQKATGCTLEKAEALSHEIDSRGRAVVFGGTQTECERVADILREISLQVETDRG
jgi:ATP-dependent Clp protease adapter protein ClpS